MDNVNINFQSFRLEDARIVGSTKCVFEKYWLQIQLEDKNDGFLNIYLVVKESENVEKMTLRWNWSIVIPSLANFKVRMNIFRLRCFKIFIKDQTMSNSFSPSNRCCLLARIKKKNFEDISSLVVKVQVIADEIS